MRTLVFGGTGMLGRAIAAHGRCRGQAVLALSRAQADIRDRQRLLYWADVFRPQLIINCAAYTQVDDCEARRELAMEVNGEAVAHVVAAAERADCQLIHVSSDYVFDGRGQEPYREDAATAPLSVYGESKLAGERQAASYPKALVLRASWLFGPGGPNFVATIRRLLLSGQDPLRVVDDQVGCPTYTPFLARALWDLAPLGLCGMLHYRNRDAVSWHGLAVEIARELRLATEILPVPTSEFPRPATRPAYSVLDVSSYQDAVGRRVETWTSGLARYIDLLGERP